MFKFELATIIALTAAVFSTAGWLYSAAENRRNSKKQRTFELLLKAVTDLEIREAHRLVAPIITGKIILKTLSSKKKKDFNEALRLLLNFYEFISNGIRNDLLDEHLVIQIEKGTILRVYEFASSHISQLRTTRRNLNIYKNLEWLSKKWS